MDTQWEEMWRFETARFAVTWEITPDYDVDLSFDETGETRANLESGRWVCFLSRFRVTLDGRTISEDYLGGSIYANPSEFRDHIGLAPKSRADGVNYGSYFSDMTRGVIAEARKALANPPRVRTAETV